MQVQLKKLFLACFPSALYLCSMQPDYPTKSFQDKRINYVYMMTSLAEDAIA